MNGGHEMEEIKNILKKAVSRKILQNEELAALLDLTEQDEREALFAAARSVRENQFGNHIFLYGFVYFSTYCRNQCSFCYYRRQNDESIRYRKSLPEILEIARALQASGVHLLDLTMGEDPYYLSDGEAGYDRLVSLVRQVKEAVGMPLMISPGVVPVKVLLRLQEAGADWYACYQETHTLSLYNRMRVYQPYDKRWNTKLFARQHGMLIEEGLLTGIGDTVQDTVHSLGQMQQLQAEQVRTMTFVPQAGTPFAAAVPADNRREINLIAVMRLLFPDRLIPASLDVEGIKGLKARLSAGANVVTSIIPPKSGLAGVSQSTLDISDGYRTVQGVTPILAECGLSAASAAEYQEWVRQMKKRSWLEKVSG